MYFRLPDLLMRRFIPLLKLNASSSMALAASFASSRAGAAILSSSLNEGSISERFVVWSVLMLSLPSYIRRWPSTFVLSVSMAGRAGGIYALCMLVISLGRFMIAYIFAREKGNSSSMDIKPSHRKVSLIKRMIKTLPIAWLFFALSYSLVPVMNRYVRSLFTGSILPLSGWSVAAGALVRVNSGLALAGGALSNGELITSQAVFALLLGSGLGTFSRVLRMNAGYYFGFFELKTARKMLVMNLLTLAPFVILSLIVSYICLGVSRG